jgi:hypothetical protein
LSSNPRASASFGRTSLIDRSGVALSAHIRVGVPDPAADGADEDRCEGRSDEPARVYMAEICHPEPARVHGIAEKVNCSNRLRDPRLLSFIWIP